MSRDKQNEIHELAKQMSEAISTEVKQRYIEDEAKLRAVLIENGWRKASEVAREIFEEIESTLNQWIELYYNIVVSTFDSIEQAKARASESVLRAFLDYLAELKKKYTEGEG